MLAPTLETLDSGLRACDLFCWLAGGLGNGETNQIIRGNIGTAA